MSFEMVWEATPQTVVTVLGRVRQKNQSKMLHRFQSSLVFVVVCWSGEVWGLPVKRKLVVSFSAHHDLKVRLYSLFHQWEVFDAFRVDCDLPLNLDRDRDRDSLWNSHDGFGLPNRPHLPQKQPEIDSFWMERIHQICLVVLN